MNRNVKLLFLFALIAFSACRYRTAPDLGGTSNSVADSEISLGGVLAEKLNGFTPIDTAVQGSQPIAIEGILNLQDRVTAMVQNQEPAISDSLLAEWKSMAEEADLSFEHFSGVDLKNWVALNDSLLKYTGLVCFADELEKVFYNSQSPDVVTDEAIKSVCYTRRYDRIYVNVYNNSTLSFKHTTGGNIRLIQDTNYPDDGEITFRVETDDSRYMDLYLRIPEWAEIASVTVLGVKYPAHPGEYTEVAKKWKNGDEVKVVLGLKPEVIRNEVGQFAFEYGPLFMTYEQDSTLTGNPKGGDPLQYLQFVSPAGKMPTFTFSGYPDHTLVLQPFYAESTGSRRTAWIRGE